MNDRYISQKLLGRGRAGEVHLAEDSMLGRKVAIRRFPEHNLQLDALAEEWQNAFMALIGGLSRLSHSSLLRMIDGGIDKEGPFLVTAYIEGKSLSDLAYGEDFAAVDAYELAQQVIDALIAAEEEGFFHLALSPTSIIAQPKHTRGYTYILTDLGHSKLLPMIHGTARAVSMTQLPALLAPEMYDGNHANSKTSQFILGHLIYWMLAGGHPFGNLTAEQAYERHKAGDLESILTYRAEIPADFVKWLEIMIKADPEERFDSLGDARAAIPEPPKRFYAKKVKLPPKSISEEDLGAKS